MMHDEILERLRAELKASADTQTAQSGEHFFKEAVSLYGVKTAIVGQIAKSHFKEVKPLGKNAIFDLCEVLWQSGYLEESFIACHWSYALRDLYAADDFAVFERWVNTYVSNWASCDTLCNHSIGTFIEKFPAYITRLKDWCASENRWVRRAAAVTFIVPARRGLFLQDILDIAECLLEDSDDLVRKGYGWMLKAASEAHQQTIFDYVMVKKERMPRTALRYAIEKMPVELKELAMKR